LGATDVAAPAAPTLALGATVSGAAARRTVIPILMYHVIAAPPAGTPYPELWVAPAAFRAQMFALARAGYRGVTLSQAFAAWRDGAPVPARPVVISFDDGYRSHSTVAAPVLRKLSWPGVLNLEINNVGADGISLRRLRGLVRDGWEIDSHTVNHPDLTTLGPAALRDELMRSRSWVRRRLGVDAAFFCYPAGRFNTTVVAAVHAAGYRGATTTLPGPATARDDPYQLPRVRVTGGETAGSVLAVLRSARARGRAPRPHAVPPSGDQ
jgi:peptidoglycan/xylan/chitin deacetylase (PgdA/CDA1 family)